MDELRIRPYKPGDASVISRWILSEKSFYQWSADRLNNYPPTADKLNAYYNSFADDDRFFQLTAIDEHFNPVAHMMMRYTTEDITKLRFGFIVVSDEYRGRGYGRKFLSLALEYAFDILKAEEVSLGVFANNPAARKCYAAVGFTESTDVKPVLYSINGEKWECIELTYRVDKWRTRTEN